MRELMRTNDPVLLSYVGAILKSSNITFMVFDQHTSLTLGGDIDHLRQRVVVPDEFFRAAVIALQDMGLGPKLSAEA